MDDACPILGIQALSFLPSTSAASTIHIAFHLLIQSFSLSSLDLPRYRGSHAGCQCVGGLPQGLDEHKLAGHLSHGLTAAGVLPAQLHVHIRHPTIQAPELCLLPGGPGLCALHRPLPTPALLLPGQQDQ